MTKREEHRIIKWFQKNLGLLGWDIKILWGPVGASDGQVPAMGSCDPDLAYHAVKIRIDSNAHTERKEAEDESHTFMHELLHCFNAACGIIDDGDLGEYAINRYASVLLKQFRADAGLK